MPAFEIKHRFTGAVLFTAELSAEYESKSGSVRLGAAVKLAVKACADLAGANLADAYLACADLACADLAGAYLADAYLAGANLARANLARAYLAGANLARANLADANLAGAYLADADLACADLACADLAGAYLADADLACANLARANLAGANLADAYLACADLACADLAGANLARAYQIIPAGTPNGWTAYGWLREGYLSVRVGCREKRLDEARAYWMGKENRREVMAALDYIETVARLRGWTIEAPAKSEAA